MPVLEGNRSPISDCEPSPATASNTSSSAASSRRKIEDGLRLEDGTGNVDDRLQELAVVLLGAEHAGRDCCAKLLAHGAPPTFVAVR